MSHSDIILIDHLPITDLILKLYFFFFTTPKGFPFHARVTGN
jgi:hypothetical protein